ncbi:MAG: DUF6057 family protein [Prevotella sp.]
MNYNKRYDNDSTTTMRVVCAVAFVSFTFAFLFFRQADVLSVAQHVLSKGQTAYSPLIGALLITFVLYFLQRGVYSLLRLKRRRHWMTYFPSMLLLAFVTDISPDIDQHFTFGYWLWAIPIVLLLWLFVSMMFRKIENYEAEINSRGLFSRLVWVNLTSLGVMILLVALISGGDDIFHYKARMERMMTEGDYAEAANVAEKSLVSDCSLTMLRCYALAREETMADKMFKYMVSGTSETMLPIGKGSRMMMYPVDSLYAFLGAKPVGPMSAIKYLRSLEASGYKSKSLSDYILCGMLIDRNIDAFVRELPRHYNVNDSLPLHYREALTLYAHRRSTPLIVYHNQVMDTDYDDMMRLEDSIQGADERKLAVFNQYFGTYWWYYDYGKR